MGFGYAHGVRVAPAAAVLYFKFFCTCYATVGIPAVAEMLFGYLLLSLCVCLIVLECMYTVSGGSVV